MDVPDAEIERGSEELEDLPEVMPEEAGPRVAEIYEDIRGTLRVPVVNFLFRATANWPETFRAGWLELRPVVGTHAFEASADALRRRAATSLPATGRPEIEGVDEIERLRAFTDTIHYVLPKLLLIAGAWHESLGTASSEVAPEPGTSSPAPLPFGAAPGMEDMEMVDPRDAPREVKETFSRIRHAHGHPGVASYYRAVARWPGFLRGVWSALEPEVRRDAYRRRSIELTHGAISAVRRLGLGGPIRLFPAAREIDPGRLRAILSVFRFRLVPDLLQDVCRIKGWLDGVPATGSPFSLGSGKPAIASQGVEMGRT